MSEKKCCHQKKYRSEEEKKKLIHRLNRIEGQIRGLRGMLEEDTYCMDILMQSSAASAALTAFNRELLCSHIESCVVDGIRQGDNEKVDELLSIIQKMIK
ncbi:MAG: metal-sensing transcriptional repressor [Eubacterium sp.]|nr:metal-sensing transcriptional repressor [Eubacterium sp.]